MKTFVVIIPTVRREIIVAERQPRVGELISSRHPGLFDAELYVKEKRPRGAFYTLQRTAWLLDKSIPWISARVRDGSLKAHRRGAEIVITLRSLNRLLREQRYIADDAWCCRVEEVEPLAAGRDADAQIRVGYLPDEYRHPDELQLCFQL